MMPEAVQALPTTELKISLYGKEHPQYLDARMEWNVNRGLVSVQATLKIARDTIIR